MEAEKRTVVAKIELTARQVEKLHSFQKEARARYMNNLREKLSPGDFEFLTKGGKQVYTGAIGGELTWEYTYTSMGDVVKATYLGQTIDLTEYDMW